MPTMQLAPSKPGHTILCTMWDEKNDIWLAGCTCGEWSCRDKGETVNQMWVEHLEDAI